ncbi:MAG: winged helix-turn-helix domain-containing protein [Planctomycetota bacterium]|nr:winged helix-turn-helix domain-containing protein [Planctomycetota bacterium]
MMKKAEVKIGGKYYANVSGNRCEIQIDAEKPRGGWDATNLATGKKIHIKSAQRLQGEVGTRRGRAKVTTEGNVTVVENEPATVETIGGEPSTAVAILKKPRKAKVANDQNAADAGEKKLSCVAAALKVLSEAIEPMNAQEMITAMTEAGYWTSPGGKTPHATLYSAILRELTKGDDSRFVKTERGRFTIRN